jgi:hypothetical protein
MLRRAPLLRLALPQQRWQPRDVHGYAAMPEAEPVPSNTD